MPIRLYHPINGYENVYSESAAQSHEKNGWIRQEEKSEIPEVQENLTESAEYFAGKKQEISIDFELLGKLEKNQEKKLPILPIPQSPQGSSNKKRGRKPKWQLQTTQN